MPSPATTGSVLLGLLLLPSLHSQDITLEHGSEAPAAGWIALPYVFSSETWDLAFGIAGGDSGWPSDNATTYAAATASTNETWNIAAGGVSWPGLLSDRLLVDPFGTYADFTNLRVYVPGNPAFVDDPDRAGSNDSDPANFFRESSEEIWLQARFRYILPIGDTRESPERVFRVDKGMLLPSEEKHPAWNPLASGRTSLLVRPYYRKQDVEIPLIDDPYAFETLNVRIGLEYDNRDFPSNPARGSYQQIALTRDWGALGETDSWTFGEIELGKYFDLGASSVFRQQVIGLNAWTGYSFTWNEIDVPGLAFPVAVNRPPYYTGATLGGQDRMRGYPAARFNGRAASYFSAEYRVIPRWTPFSVAGIDEMLDMDWWQISLFFEAGRVSDSLDAELYYEDLKYDVGVDLRFFVRKAVVRVGVAASEETVQVVAMFGQPF